MNRDCGCDSSPLPASLAGMQAGPWDSSAPATRLPPARGEEAVFLQRPCKGFLVPQQVQSCAFTSTCKRSVVSRQEGVAGAGAADVGCD